MSIPKEELKRFGENTTIRGIPRLFKSDDKFLKVVWSIAVIACTAMLIAFLITIFQQFFKWPVNTKYGENAAGKNVFPDITICSLNRFLDDMNNSKLLNEYFGNFSDDKRKKKSMLIGILNSMSGFALSYGKDILVSSGECPNFITECWLYYENWQSGTYCTNNFVESWTAEYFTCKTLRTSSIFINTGRMVRGILLILNNAKQFEDQLPYYPTLTASQALGAVISIDNPGTPPDMKKGFTVGPGTENVIKIVQTNVKRLDTPYDVRGCTNQKTISNLSKFAYDFGICQERCYQERIYSKCNCIVRSLDLPESLSNALPCWNLTDALNSDVSDTFDEKVMCASSIFFSGDDCKNCKQPCDELTYQYTVSSAPWPPLCFQVGVYRKYIKNCIAKFPEVKERYAAYDYFDKLQGKRNDTDKTFNLSDLKQIGESLISVKFVMEVDKPFKLEEKPQYTWDVMVSLIGGMLSLWLGISIMTIFEVFEFFYRSFKGCKLTKENATKRLHCAI